MLLIFTGETVGVGGQQLLEGMVMLMLETSVLLSLSRAGEWKIALMSKTHSSAMGRVRERSFERLGVEDGDGEEERVRILLVEARRRFRIKFGLGELKIGMLLAIDLEMSLIRVREEMGVVWDSDSESVSESTGLLERSRLLTRELFLTLLGLRGL